MWFGPHLKNSTWALQYLRSRPCSLEQLTNPERYVYALQSARIVMALISSKQTFQQKLGT